MRVLELFESGELEFPRRSYEFSNSGKWFGPRDNWCGSCLGSILVQKTRELGLVVNMKLVGLCLGFPTVYYMSLLDVPSKSYGQFVSGCPSWVPQWE